MKTVNRSIDSVRLMAREPAKIFEQAYPIGNGFSGAMLFGDPKKDRLVLNHDKLWSGYPMDKLKEEPTRTHSNQTHKKLKTKIKY